MSEFYTIVTNIGAAKIANAEITDKKLNITHYAVGDSNGSYYNPTVDQTALRKEVWRGPAICTVDDSEPNIINIDSSIPPEIGGFMVREIGLFDADGDLVVVGKIAEYYKPIITQGSTLDAHLRTRLVVSNNATIVLKNDPNLISATRGYVDKEIVKIAESNVEFKEEVTKHLADYSQFKTETDTKLEVISDPSTGVEAKLNAHKEDYTDHIYYADDTGTANAKILSIPGITAYKKGLAVSFVNKVANTGAVTINVNGFGVVNLLDGKGNALKAGKLLANIPYSFRHNGLGFILEGEGGGAKIKSVQRGTVTMSTGDVLVNIAAVDLSKAYIQITVAGNGVAIGAGAYARVHAMFNTASQIILTRYEYSADMRFAVDISWEVIEFEGDVKVQRGTVAIDNNQYTIASTIAAVNLTKSYVVFTGRGPVEFSPYPRAALSNSTTLTFTRASPTSMVMLSWFVIEFTE